MIIKETKIIEREVYVAPCIKCGNTDILIGDCGYSSFNIAYGRCKKCKNEITFTCGLSPNKITIINRWNVKNDVPLMISEKLLEIDKLKQDIKDLKLCQKQNKKSK